MSSKRGPLSLAASWLKTLAPERPGLAGSVKSVAITAIIGANALIHSAIIGRRHSGVLQDHNRWRAPYAGQLLVAGPPQRNRERFKLRPLKHCPPPRAHAQPPLGASAYSQEAGANAALPSTKGTMSELELSLFRQRSQEALKSKARRGALFLRVAAMHYRKRANA
jgi:hypothetical protein